MLKQYLTLALTCSLLSVSILAQQPLLPFLPADTLMAVSVPNLEATMASMSEMPLAKIWREEEVQKFLGDAREMLKTRIDEMLREAKQMHEQGAFPMDPEKLLSLRMRGGTFAITKMGIQMGDSGPEPEFGFMLHMDFGESAEQWNALIQLGMAMLKERASSKLSMEESKVGDVLVISMVPMGMPNIGAMGINVAMVPNGILLGTLKDQVLSVVESMQKGKPVLAESANYKNTLKHISADGVEAEVYMRPVGFIDFGLAALKMSEQLNPTLNLDVDGFKRSIDVMGLRAMQAMGAATSYKGGKAITTSFMGIPAPSRTPVVEAMFGGSKTLDQGFLKWVPKEAVSFHAGTVDALSLYDGMMDAFKAYSEPLATQMNAEMAKAEKEIGFSLRDDLFGAIGDTYAYWYMPFSPTPTPPESALVVKVKDEEKLLKVFRAIAARSDGMFTLDESEKRGVKSYQVRINIEQLNAMPVNPFESLTPTFAFKGGYMVAGFSASDIRRVFKMMDRKDDETTAAADIRSNKEFAAYAGKIPADIQSLGFTDWKMMMESVYTAITTVLAIIPMSEDIPIDTAMLPDAGTITKHMFGSLSYSRADAAGYTWSNSSPFGMEVGLLGVVGAVMVAVGVSMRGF